MSRTALALHALAGLLATALVAAASAPAAAQSLWMQRDGDHTILLEMLRPSIEDVDGKLLTGAFFLSGRTKVSPGVSLVGELPYLRFASSLLGTDVNGNEITVDLSSSTIGNPYVGMEAGLGSGPAFVEVGFRPPLASDEEYDAVLTGYFTDMTRLGGFLPNYASIQAGINLREVTDSKIMYRVRLSPMVAIPTKGGGDSELFAMYSFQMGYHGTVARVGTGISGQALITEDTGNIGGRTRTHLEIHADFLPGAIRPGLDLQLPIGGEAGLVPVVVGASVSWMR